MPTQTARPCAEDAEAGAVWALLPVVADRQLGAGADGYGALFGALSTGAIVAALVLGPLRTRLATGALLAAAGLLYATATVALVLASNLLTAGAALLVAGIAWMATTATLAEEMQMLLPAAVRARGLAVYTVTFCGSQAVGALLAGLLAGQLGLRPALLASAAAVAAGALTCLRGTDAGHFAQTGSPTGRGRRLLEGHR